MTPNKTSQAVEALGAFLKEARQNPLGYGGQTRDFALTNRQMEAIAQKYQRMEKALQLALQDLERCIESPENHDIEPIREALSFDPLA